MILRVSDVVLVQGLCADRAKLTSVYSYHRAEFRKPALEDLESILKRIRTTLHEKLAISSYAAQCARYVWFLDFLSYNIMLPTPYLSFLFYGI